MSSKILQTIYGKIGVLCRTLGVVRMGHRYAGAVWKCLSIYDTFGEDSYQGYLFKLIVRMSQDDSLTETEHAVLEMLKGLKKTADIATKKDVRSVILDCSAKLYDEQ